MRRVVTVLLTAGLLWGLSASPGAAQSPPELIVGPQTGSIYATFRIIGTECSQPATGSWNVYTATGNTSLLTGTVTPNTNGVWDGSFSGSALSGIGDYRLEADCGGVAYDPVTFTLVDAPGPGMTVTPTSGTVDDVYSFQGTGCHQALESTESGSWELYKVGSPDSLIAAGGTQPDDFGVWDDTPPIPLGVGEFRLEADCGSLVYDPVTFTVAEVPVDAPAPPAPAGPVQTRPAFTG